MEEIEETEPCSTCRNLEPLPGLAGGFITGGIGNDLKNSAPSCQLCSILWEGLEAFCYDNPGASQWMALRQLEDPFRLQFKQTPEEKNWSGIQFYTNSSQDPLSDIFKPSSDLEPDSSSPKYLSQMKGWVETCNEKHPVCKARLNDHLPTRVLDVSRDADLIYLYEPTEKDRGSYVALSHCWGGVVPLMTMQSSLEGFKTGGISLETFPKTFQDAILVTRHLECRYIWIDSLCIIQDNTDDWIHEASRMAEVYGNSYVTLAATASRNSYGGLFHEHDKLDVGHLISRTAKDGKAAKVSVRPALEHTPYFASSPHGLDASAPAPLLERSWCFQEYLLAPRVLSFTRWEILWVCLSKRSCNCGEYTEQTRELVAASDLKARFDAQLRGPFPSSPSSSSPSSSPTSLSSPSSPSSTTTTTATTTTKDLRRLWQDIIEAYLQKGLTYDADRLPALAGIARRFAEHGLGRYVSGLWEPTLVSDLFWSLDASFGDYHGVVAKRSGDGGMPSWSWASVVGAFRYSASSYALEGIEVRGVEFEGGVRDALAEVVARRIMVRGVLTRARAWGGGGDEDEGRRIRNHSRRIQVPGAKEHGWFVDVASELACGVDKPADVHILRGTKGPGLVLRHVEDTACTYRRLGLIDGYPPIPDDFDFTTVELV